VLLEMYFTCIYFSDCESKQKKKKKCIAYDPPLNKEIIYQEGRNHVVAGMESHVETIY
jgi:hypothetical protein